jgi:drug/metabolite transporter (DMT)-like permease
MSHDKQTRIIFALVTFSWATSWFFAKMQIAFVPQEMSVCYRFFLAGIILIFYSILTKKNFKFSQKEYLLIGIQAVCVFSVNHLFFYQAMHYISSGVVAALFSLSIILSAIFNFLFYQEKTDSKIIIGGGIGIIGLGLIFAGDFQKLVSILI